MALDTLLPRSTECNVVQDGAIVSDRGSLSNDNAGPMIEHNPRSQRSVGVDVDLEHLRDLTLQKLGHDGTWTAAIAVAILVGEGTFAFAGGGERCRVVWAVAIPQVVCHTVRLECVKALEIQKHIGQIIARWVTIANGHHVGTQIASKGGRMTERVLDD